MATNNLKSLLEKHGFSQAELSASIGVSVGTINKVCNLKLTPAPRTQNKIIIGFNKLAETSYEKHEVFK